MFSLLLENMDKTICKNISKTLSDKYSQNLAKTSSMGAFKFSLNEVI